MMFRIGQKVVCMDDGIALNGIPVFVTSGNIYTIGFIRHSGCIEVAGVLGIYRADRFRPLVERKTSIEIFQRMLTPSRQKESVR